jgi:hypothetical protein
VTPGTDERAHDVVTLRDGTDHVVMVDAAASATHLLDEVSARRSQLLLTVCPPPGSRRAVFSCAEIIRLGLADP